MRWICKNCDWVGTVLLDAPHPFIEGVRIAGCPDCKEVDGLQSACAADDCKREASCGTPTPDGYKHFCYDHGKTFFK
jgi:hypothetical protein